jgi:hypothetical protein
LIDNQTINAKLNQERKMKIEKLYSGQYLHDYHMYREGNTMRKKMGHWRVRVIQIDMAGRRVLAEWNSNAPRWYSEKAISKFRIKERNVE